MKATQKGFTLIELIVVLVIIGMISAFALPKYQDHIARTQATEAMQLIEPLKTELYENVHYNNKCINNNNDKEIHEGKFARAIISNNDDYIVQLTTNEDPNNFLPNAREDTGCRIYIKYKKGTNEKIRDKNLVLAYLYNGQLVALNDETESIATKYTPDPLKIANDSYVVARKPFKVDFGELDSNDDRTY